MSLLTAAAVRDLANRVARLEARANWRVVTGKITTNAGDAPLAIVSTDGIDGGHTHPGDIIIAIPYPNSGNMLDLLAIPGNFDQVVKVADTIPQAGTASFIAITAGTLYSVFVYTPAK